MALQRQEVASQRGVEELVCGCRRAWGLQPKLRRPRRLRCDRDTGGAVRLASMAPPLLLVLRQPRASSSGALLLRALRRPRRKFQQRHPYSALLGVHAEELVNIGV